MEKGPRDGLFPGRRLFQKNAGVLALDPAYGSKQGPNRDFLKRGAVLDKWIWRRTHRPS
jgi:hypothetical protein